MKDSARQPQSKGKRAIWVRGVIVVLGVALMAAGTMFTCFDEMRNALASTTSPYWEISGTKIFYPNGNVGIGTPNPKTKLNISTGITGYAPVLGVSSGNLFLGGDNNLYGLYSGSVSVNGNSWLQVMRNDSAIAYNLLLQPAGGNVGIGTTNPAVKLDIAGTESVALRLSNGGDLVITSQVSGASTTLYNDFGSLNITTAVDVPGNHVAAWDLLAYGGLYVAGGSFIKNTGEATFPGSVGIGTGPSGTYKLAVNGTIRAKEIVVDSGWADYVFEDSYQLMPLRDLALYVDEYDHLPNMPTSAEVSQSGVNVGDTQAKLLEKVEELTLYTIEQQKQIDELRAVVKSLQR